MPSNTSTAPQQAALLRASSELEPVGVSEVLRSISNPRSRPTGRKSPTNSRPSASSNSSGNGTGASNSSSSRGSGSGSGAMSKPRLSTTPSKARRPVSPARPLSASRASRRSPSTERAREPLACSPSGRSIDAATGAGKKARPLPSTMKTVRAKNGAAQNSPGTKNRSSTRVHSDEDKSMPSKSSSGAPATDSADAMEASGEEATDTAATDDAAMNIDLDEDAPPPPPEAGPFDTTTKPKKSPKTRARNRSEDAPVLPDDVSASDEATQRLYLRFLLSENGDAKKAGKRFKETIAWRADIDLATVYEKGNPQFWPIKCFVPHCFHGRDKSGRLVIYQRPALMNLAKLHEHGLDLLKFKAHYVWLEEYLAREVYATDSDSALKVIDLQGLKREHLTPDVRELLKISMRLGSHYPGRTYRLVLINKPFWASVLLLFINGTGLYSGTPMMSYTPKHTLAGLLEFVDVTEIPADYGGQSPFNLGSAPDELSLYRAVHGVQASLGEPVMNLRPDLIEHMSGWVPDGPSAIAADGSAPTP